MRFLQGFVANGKRRRLLAIFSILAILPVMAFVEVAGAAHRECETSGDNAGSQRGSWQEALSMMNHHSGAATVADDSGCIYVIGGFNDAASGTPESYDVSVEVFDGEEWRSITHFGARSPFLGTRRAYLGAAKDSDGRIYAIGGEALKRDPLSGENELQVYDTVEMFDPHHPEDGWTEMEPMPTPRTGLAVATGNDGKIYAFAGATSNPLGSPVEVNVVEVFTPPAGEDKDGSWALVPTSSVEPPFVPASRSGLAAAVGPDGGIYLLGGIIDRIVLMKGGVYLADADVIRPGTALGTVEVYYPGPNGGTWKSSERGDVPALTTARSYLAAATGPDGLIYAIGGGPFRCCGLDTVEAYDPGPQGAGEWVGKPAIRRRHSLAAVRVGDGSDGVIYAIGGSSNSADSPGKLVQTYRPGEAPSPEPVELVDCLHGPTPGNWDGKWETLPNPPMRAPGRIMATGATDGRVYTVGGVDPDTGNVVPFFHVCDPTNGKWMRLPDMPTPRTEAAAASAPDGRIFVFGGHGSATGADGWPEPLDVVEAYDPQSKTWKTSTRGELRPLPTARRSAAAVAAEGRIYVLGGRTTGIVTNTVNAYDPVENTWSSAASMARSRMNFGATLGPDRRIYALGGEGNYPLQGLTGLEVEAYDPATDTWSAAPPMAVERKYDPGAAIDRFGRIYAIAGGGRGTVEFHLPGTDDWSQGPTLPMERDQVSVTTSGDGRIYALNDTGELNVFTPMAPTIAPKRNSCPPTVRPFSFPEKAGEWQRLATSDFPSEFQLKAITESMDGRFYALGTIARDGSNPEFFKDDTLLAYDPEKRKWQRKSDMPVKSSAAIGGLGRFAVEEMESGPDGLIYVFSSFRLSETVVTAYDPCTDSWTDISKLTRNQPPPGAVVTGPDKRMYLLGPGSLVEAYDPQADQLTRVAPMTEPRHQRRANPGATLGVDGRIYAVSGNASSVQGGVTVGNSSMVSTAEAYRICTDSWEPIAPLNAPRENPSIVTAGDGRIYAIAGINGPGPQSTNAVEAYGSDITWDPSVQDIPFGRSFPSAVTDSQGRIYLLDGNSFEVYQPLGTLDNKRVKPACPSLVIDDPVVREGHGLAIFSLSMDVPPAVPVQVAYETQDVSAKSSEGDYKQTVGTVTFLPGETEKKVAISVNEDNVTDDKEVFALNLNLSGTPPGAFLKDPQGLATILDPTVQADPAAPTASIGDVVVPEPYKDTAPAVFTLTLSKPADTDIAFSYATKDGSAQKGLDYHPAQGTVTVPKGATAATIETTVIGDTTKEPQESYYLDISGGQGAVIQKATGEAMILDAGPGISVGDVSVTEGNAGTTPAVFTVVANSPPDAPARARFSTHEGTADPKDDYTEKTETLTLNPGQVATTVTVDIKADTIPEQDEDFSVSLSEPAGAVLLKALGKGTVRNDDGPPPPRSLTPIPAAGFAPGSLPPPATINAAQSQAQTSSQAQSQFQAQSQAQAQAAAQLNQNQTTVAQTQPQAAAAAERERQKDFQVEKETGEISSSKATGYLAASSSQTVPQSAAALAWAGSIFALAAGLLYKNRNQNKDKRRQPAYVEDHPQASGQARFRPLQQPKNR